MTNEYPQNRVLQNCSCILIPKHPIIYKDRNYLNHNMNELVVEIELKIL